MSQESSNTLGDFLRQERERVGLTLEQVASATKINIKLLHALESDQYDDLPAKPFIRGYVIAYARFIGIDPKEVLTQFGSFIDIRTEQRSPKRASVGPYVFEKREGEQSRTWLAAVMGAGAVVVALFFLMKPKHSRHHRQVEKLKGPQATASVSPSTSSSPAEAAAVTSPSASPSAVAQPSPLASVKPSPSPSPSVKPSASPSPSTSPKASPSPGVSRKPDPMKAGADLLPSEIKQKILIKANEDVFIRYIVDQKDPHRFVLKGGKMMSLKAAERIFLQLSDPAAATVSINGKADQTLVDVPGVKVFDGITTIGAPQQVMEIKENPFKGLRALPQVPKVETEPSEPDTNEDQ
ncbi:MAG: helix-turn-helix domain-containing protein [Bdellovibrionales bacterium]|nr:helix-turn-helix domain-containing protein [Bdellovibrionales bacterium]